MAHRQIGMEHGSPGRQSYFIHVNPDNLRES